jgi:hypothetical protein
LPRCAGARLTVLRPIDLGLLRAPDTVGGGIAGKRLCPDSSISLERR